MLLRGSLVSFFVGTQVYVCVTFHFERWDASFHVRMSVQLIAEERGQPDSFLQIEDVAFRPFMSS